MRGDYFDTDIIRRTKYFSELFEFTWKRSSYIILKHNLFCCGKFVSCARRHKLREPLEKLNSVLISNPSKHTCTVHMRLSKVSPALILHTYLDKEGLLLHIL